MHLFIYFNVYACALYEDTGACIYYDQNIYKYDLCVDGKHHIRRPGGGQARQAARLVRRPGSSVCWSCCQCRSTDPSSAVCWASQQPHPRTRQSLPASSGRKLDPKTLTTCSRLSSGVRFVLRFHPGAISFGDRRIHFPSQATSSQNRKIGRWSFRVCRWSYCNRLPCGIYRVVPPRWCSRKVVHYWFV